jgi:hypothetical protein
MTTNSLTHDIVAGVQNIDFDRAQSVSPSTSASTPKSVLNDGSHLLKLPNELLLNIAGYLGLSRNQRYGTKYQQNEFEAWETTEARQGLASAVKALLQFALTSKRLVPIAQDVLYREVFIPQPFRSQLPGKPAPSFLPCFLRTILQCPELGAHVRKLAVWIWKGQPIRSPVDSKETFCACGTCLKALAALIDTPKLSEAEKVAWMEELSCPTEAAVCGLIFAALPNLQTLELYAQPLSADYKEDRDLFKARNASNVLGPINATQYTSDVLRLAQGLAITKSSPSRCPPISMASTQLAYPLSLPSPWITLKQAHS